MNVLCRLHLNELKEQLCQFFLGKERERVEKRLEHIWLLDVNLRKIIFFETSLELNIELVDELVQKLNKFTLGVRANRVSQKEESLIESNNILIEAFLEFRLERLHFSVVVCA